MLGSCTAQDKKNPEKVAEEFVSLWEEQDFDAMYTYLSNSSKEQYSKKEFIERNEKIFKDLQMSDLKISKADLTDKQRKKSKENKEITIDTDINFDTIAGEIDFTKEIPLIFKETDEESMWRIDWDEGFILPGLTKKGKVDITKIQPRRGEILDRNKMPLALNDVAYEIGIIPEDFSDDKSDKQKISDLLDISTKKIDEKLDASWVQPDYFVPIATIPTAADDKLETLTNIAGVTYQETTGRNYPLEEAAAHITGYIGQVTEDELKDLPKGEYSAQDLIGKNGLEEMYEDTLHGEEGIEINIITEKESGSKEKDTIAEKPVVNGDNIQLTIDVNIQEKIYQAYEDKSGTSAAIDPKSGEVLALVSSPGYNPNEFIYGISDDRWDQLMEHPDEPFLNRSRSTFAPGSSIKPITAAVGLANETINFTDSVEINGLTWGKEEWGDVKVTRVSTSDKPVTLEDALTRSDNIYFAMKAVDMGNEKFIKGMQDIGFEENIPFQMPIENSQISNDGKLDEILLANSGYGQGEIEMSSLHIALSYTMFLNEGDMLKPSLLLNKNEREVWKENFINKDQADQMKKYLREVVSEGTAKTANDDDLHISGKTGTAELKLTKETADIQNGWFVGYPTDDEDILIAMMIEGVEDVGASSYVAGKVKDVLKDIKD
ncbi:MAG TPA: penicillin-binding transpeptidase domain-containing protein [Pseudogracilibacillus sp.]|nr:penicillin-binding transpeptidase domain-containing protein [Pseudogracilibacillus sp.]